MLILYFEEKNKMKPYCYICWSGPPWRLLERACQNLSDQVGPRKYARTQQSVHGEETSSPKKQLMSDFSAFRINNLCEMRHLARRTWIWYRSSISLIRKLVTIWLVCLYKDVTVSIAQVCYQCGNIRRVFKSPEPERRPSLMPETRIWVSFRSPDHIYSLRSASLLMAWLPRRQPRIRPRKYCTCST